MAGKSMNRVAAGFAAAVALQAGLAFAQGTPPSHAGHHGKAPAPKNPPAAEQSGQAKFGEAGAYDSPFLDYRPFDPQEPAKPWRAANEEVRDAGGHLGVMKAIEAAKSASPKDSKR
jgi:hypothetical protein